MIETQADYRPRQVRSLASKGTFVSQRFRPRALVVAADPFVSHPLTSHLERGGFETASVIAGEGALSEIGRVRPHVVFLHMAEGHSPTLALCREIRAAVSTPIIVCSTSHDISQLVDALGAGADDHFVLPLSTPEFLARARAVMRRVRRAVAGPPADRLVAGDIEVRPYEYRAYRNGDILSLSPMEFRLLTELVRHSGHTVGHGKLLARACGGDYVDSAAMLRIYVRRLRTRLGDAALITSDRGIGYRFQPALPASFASSAA